MINASAGVFPKKDIAGIRKLKVQCLAKKSRISQTIWEAAQLEHRICLLLSMNWMTLICNHHVERLSMRM